MGSFSFHPFVHQWFHSTLGAPTPAQERGWAAIANGQHTLIAAPTGSGKTLAAFLFAIDELVRESLDRPLPDEVRVLYVSPLKALSSDIHKNLEEPRNGIAAIAAAQGAEALRITAAVRTGDTTASARAAMVKTPPHILVTTPESLYLLLTSARSRQMLATVRTVIVDEIHAVIGRRRGAHLALSLERLQRVAGRPLQRIGLSATQKPIEDVAKWLVGTEGAACEIVNEGHGRPMDLDIELPRSELDAVMAHEVWGEYYDRLAELAQAHRTTLVFVNTRKLAERVARHLSERLGEELVATHHGSLSKETRLDAETRLKAGRLRVLVATASLELGIDIGSVDLVCQIGSPHTIAALIQRVGRSGHRVGGLPKGRVFPETRDDLLECVALIRALKRGELDAIVPHDAPLDVLTQQIVAETSAAEEAIGEGELLAMARRAWPYRALERRDFEAVVAMAAEGFSTRKGRRSALLHRDEVHGTVRGRRGARLLAQVSGGAIPEVADYRVVLDPGETFIGTLNEDFAIESNAGDIFQLGNASWQILQVTTGVVRVADAKGAPPSIPFWLGEAPARSNELSHAVSSVRQMVSDRFGDRHETVGPDDVAWLAADAGVNGEAALQVLAFLDEGRRALDAIPTQQTLVLERFFDESGGMQLVLHAPFGSRINKAWCLALRKKFCRQFNFELQAAATEDAILLSLGPQHSFPLADVFRYLHPETARDVLVQAFLDAPVFKTRWRWNATISLAVPRARGSRRVAPQLQRMLADDLMASVFPDAAACLENIPGDRQLPDHPLVNQTVRDCLQEAMDFDGLRDILTRIHRGEFRLLARDTPEPSVFATAILNAKPYAFMDDAPLEERRVHAVQTRRGRDDRSVEEGAVLDAAAVQKVRQEAAPDPRDADELHDALMICGALTADEMISFDPAWFDTLVTSGRAALVAGLAIATERLPEWQAVHPALAPNVAVVVPAGRAGRRWMAGEALTEIVRSRLTIAGPTTAAGLALVLGTTQAAVDDALLALESEGVVLRGRFTSQRLDIEWCDRALLARIHRYTLTRLRAEIEPVSPADFMRFLFKWQHVDEIARLTGPEGLKQVLDRLDGFEAPARAWERSILPARLDGYEPSQLDMACLSGDVRWGRASAPGVLRTTSATPIALVTSDHSDAWLPGGDGALLETLSDDARVVMARVEARGPSFFRELASSLSFDTDRLRIALSALVAAGLAASDGFAGLRLLVAADQGRPWHDRRPNLAGRWNLIDARRGEPSGSPDTSREAAVEVQAWSLLHRYGIVFRRLLIREAAAAPWRELTRVYRRLEARGEIRGGRFVSGMSGEQYALPDAVPVLREVRRTPPNGAFYGVSTADPLNLAGIVTAGARVAARGRNRIAYRDGVPVAVFENQALRMLEPLDAEAAASAARAMSGRARVTMREASRA
ncbi:MAG TPA: DEAD/DEAH box helicase [Vicinamibacterales bacterium]|jgi:ATP-dependent Lhr-like helicase|nr:DEAD/DEAH box helicase [Vicinamibacterales bacterium]